MLAGRGRSYQAEPGAVHGFKGSARFANLEGALSRKSHAPHRIGRPPLHDGGVVLDAAAPKHPMFRSARQARAAGKNGYALRRVRDQRSPQVAVSPQAKQGFEDFFASGALFAVVGASSGGKGRHAHRLRADSQHAAGAIEKQDYLSRLDDEGNDEGACVEHHTSAPIPRGQCGARRRGSSRSARTYGRTVCSKNAGKAGIDHCALARACKRRARRAFHLLRSTAAAICTTRSSRHGWATICKPTGMPSSPLPARIEPAGLPVRLNG